MILLVLAVLFLTGITTENLITATKPIDGSVKINIDEVKKIIQQAGIVPYEAQYWQEVH